MSTTVEKTESLSKRVGDDYLLSANDIQAFHDNGFLHLEDVITEDEVQAIEPHYNRITNNEIPNMGRNLCDMSGSYNDKFEDFNLINANIPRHYIPELRDNIYERITASIARQLYGEGMALDYDQFLTKKPSRKAAAFAWHQDMGYWPVGTPDTKTATCSLAMTDSTLENGCLRFVPGSHKSQRILKHRPAGNTNTRDEAHTMILDISDQAEVAYQPVKRGSITVHDEWIIHGSDGNQSDTWRKTYIVAYRSEATVKHERKIGFTHSHNDTVNWQTVLDLENS